MARILHSVPSQPNIRVPTPWHGLYLEEQTIEIYVLVATVYYSSREFIASIQILTGEDKPVETSNRTQ